MSCVVAFVLIWLAYGAVIWLGWVSPKGPGALPPQPAAKPRRQATPYRSPGEGVDPRDEQIRRLQEALSAMIDIVHCTTKHPFRSSLREELSELAADYQSLLPPVTDCVFCKVNSPHPCPTPKRSNDNR